MKEFKVPMGLDTDAYQLGHFLQIPPGMEHFQLSQSIYRAPKRVGLPKDYRLLMAGSLPFVKLELEDNPMTMADIDEIAWFLEDFHADNKPPFAKPYPFPRQMFEETVRRYNGIPPVVIMALQDGQTHFVGEPHLQIWTDEVGMGEWVGFLEARMLPYLWTMSAVATRGRKRRQRLLELYRKHHPNMAEEDFLLDAKFHDFGRRGGAAAQMTGIAHLMNWLGTDTMSAAYAATKYLNDGRKFGANSIMAAAHRTVTPWNRENQAVRNMVKRCGNGIMAFVADSYDYERCMELLGEGAQYVQGEGGLLVGRPDSGDPVEVVIQGLRIFEKAFGADEVNGLKILRGAGVIQGDGVSDDDIFERILPAVIEAGFSPLNVSFGMGEHNHKAARSETELGLKTAAVGQFDYGLEDDVDIEAFPGMNATATDVWDALRIHNVMKRSESFFKRSIPGPVSIHLDSRMHERVRPISVDQLRAGNVGDYKVIFDGRPARQRLPVETYSFEETRKLAHESWDSTWDYAGDTIHADIRAMQEAYMETILGA